MYKYGPKVIDDNFPLFLPPPPPPPPFFGYSMFRKTGVCRPPKKIAN